MDKKLPKVFANKFNKEVKNNERVYYSNENRSVPVEKKTRNISFDKTVEQKINDIFNSVKYVYKADVDITLKSGKSKRRIIGRNKNNLITMENELIPIDAIIDIEYSE